MSEEKKIDYLEVDDPIGGQNYACMSFISPESLIKDKEGFKVTKFLQSYCKENKLKFEEVYEQYKGFCYKHEDKLQRDFDESNDFQTSLRGIKVRGVFDTREAAENRAKKLSTLDSSFHVFIGQVGYWLPWDPNADKVESEHFQNSQLNDMMEKYQENNVNRDIFYEEQKRDKIKAAQEEALQKKKEAAKNIDMDNVDDYTIEKIEEESLPPWRSVTIMRKPRLGVRQCSKDHFENSSTVRLVALGQHTPSLSVYFSNVPGTTFSMWNQLSATPPEAPPPPPPPLVTVSSSARLSMNLIPFPLFPAALPLVVFIHILERQMATPFVSSWSRYSFRFWLWSMMNCFTT